MRVFRFIKVFNRESDYFPVVLLFMAAVMGVAYLIGYLFSDEKTAGQRFSEGMGMLFAGVLSLGFLGYLIFELVSITTRAWKKSK